MDIISPNILSKIVLGTFGLIGLVFLIVTVSLIYHWNYYGISAVKRLFIIILYIGGAFVLFMSALGLAIDYI